MKIEELISGIKRQEIVVPEFQREFVWGANRAKDLIRSLLNEYPIGGILIWKTDNPPQLKGPNFDEPEGGGRTYQVLLDGQQRSTALYMLITGEIPPFYKQGDINSDPRELSYNLYTGELQYMNSSMSKDKSWQYVTDCLNDRVDHLEIAFDLHEAYSKLADLKSFTFDFKIEDGVWRHFNKIRTLLNSAGLNIAHASKQIWKIEIPTKTINVTITELDALYERPGEQDDGSNHIDQKKFMAFWKEKVIAEIELLLEEYQDQKKLVSRVNNNFNKLSMIPKREILAQEIPASAEFSDAVDIFDKINSGGVQLSKSELALTHITAIWPEARREMKKTLDNLKSRGFDLDLSLMTRLLIVQTTGRASFDAIGRASYDAIRMLNYDLLSHGWTEAKATLSYLLDILKSEKVTNSSLIKSKVVIVPVFHFLSLHGGTFKNDSDRSRAIHWFHTALIWGRYAGSTDQKLEEDVNATRHPSPWEALINKIIDQRGRIRIEASDLEGQGANSRFFNSFCVMLAQKGAKDWFNGIGIDSGTESNYTMHKHHIFPVALLTRTGYSEHNDRQNALINELSNLAIIADSTNLKISDKPPEQYFVEIQKNYPSALQSQLIPEDEELWKETNFLDFLEVRRRLIADAMNGFLDGYLSGNTPETENEEVAEIIILPESETQEYKETWAYDVRVSGEQQKPVKSSKVQLSCIKTVAAFLNSNGGDLFIGITDNLKVEGLNNDLDLVSNDIDKLERQISQVLLNSLGAAKKPFYRLKMIEFEGKFICRVMARACYSSKTWVTFEGEQTFYVRNGNQTIALRGSDVDEYWEDRER